MRYDSYTFLIPMTCLVLAGLTGFLLWHIEIRPVTFLRGSTFHYLFLAASASAIVGVYPLQRSRIKAGLPVKWTDLVVLFLGVLLVSLPVFYFVLTALTFWLPGTHYTYTTTYTYNRAGSRSCSSATVIDPVLERAIAICRPVGGPVDYQLLRVNERVNTLGIVTVYSRFVPDTVADRPQGFYPFNPTWQ